jgi:hypothetical protein
MSYTEIILIAIVLIVIGSAILVKFIIPKIKERKKRKERKEREERVREEREEREREREKREREREREKREDEFEVEIKNGETKKFTRNSITKEIYDDIKEMLKLGLSIDEIKSKYCIYFKGLNIYVISDGFICVEKEKFKNIICLEDGFAYETCVFFLTNNNLLIMYKGKQSKYIFRDNYDYESYIDILKIYDLKSKCLVDEINGAFVKEIKNIYKDICVLYVRAGGALNQKAVLKKDGSFLRFRPEKDPIVFEEKEKRLIYFQSNTDKNKPNGYFIFKDVEVFKDGYFSVKLHEKWSLIDKNEVVFSYNGDVYFDNIVVKDDLSIVLMINNENMQIEDIEEKKKYE